MIGTGVFSALVLTALWRNRLVAVVLFAVLTGGCAACWIVPAPMQPIYRGWLRMTSFFGRRITGLTLALFYLGVVTPVAVIGRRWLRRSIVRRSDPASASYWFERSEPVQPLERYSKRY